MRKKVYKNANERSSAWSRKHIKTYSIKLNVDDDSEVIAKLSAVENKTDYVRFLVEKDIGLKPRRKIKMRLLLSNGFIEKFGVASKDVAIAILEKKKKIPADVIIDTSEDGASFHVEGEEGNILCVEKNGYILMR